MKRPATTHKDERRIKILNLISPLQETPAGNDAASEGEEQASEEGGLSENGDDASEPSDMAPDRSAADPEQNALEEEQLLLGKRREEAIIGDQASASPPDGNEDKKEASGGGKRCHDMYKERNLVSQRGFSCCLLAQKSKSNATLVRTAAYETMLWCSAFSSLTPW